VAKKKRQFKKSKVDLKIAEIIRERGFTHKAISHIHTYKNNTNYGDLFKFYSQLPSQYVELLNIELLPQEIKNLNADISGYYSDNLEDNLNSMLVSFKLHKEKINKFIIKKKKFENKFLSSSYKLSQKILEETIDDISYSNWYIYNMLLVKEFTEGFDGSFAYLKELLQEGSEHPINNIFYFAFQRMVDRDLNIRSYDKYLENDVYGHYNINTHDIKEYIESYIDPFEVYGVENINNVFYAAENNSLIDRYLMFRKVLINLLVKDRKLALKIIKRALQYIHDPQLEKIYFFISSNLPHESNEEKRDMYSILDLYTTGKYIECISTIEKYLATYELSIDVIELYLKAHININKEWKSTNESSSLKNNIILAIYNILLKNNLTSESIGYLNTLALSLHSFDFATQILYFLEKIKNLELNPYNLIYQIYSPIITPKASYNFSDFSVRKQILSNLLHSCKNQVTLKFFIRLLDYELDKTVSFDDLNISKKRLELHKSRILFLQDNYDEVIKSLEILLPKLSLIPHLHEECLVRLYNAHSLKNETLECIDLYVRNHLFNKYLLSNIETSKEINYIDRDLGYKSLSINMKLIIFLHIRKASSKTLSLVYRMLIRKISVKTPSSISLDDFETTEIIYFLRFVAVQDILSKDVMNFKTLKDVEQERVKICQLLLSLDDDDSNIYNDEIIKITRSMNIKERMKEVSSSKIYIDIEGLKNYDFKDFEKSFLRFKKIKDLSAKSFEDFYMMVSENGTDNLLNKLQQKKKYLTQEIQLKDMFLELFMDVREKYLFSNEHGLDAYLSTRIRHGTITGQLRKTFSDLQLITTKDSKTNEYLDNSCWYEKDNIQDSKLVAFNCIMNTFSNDVDSHNAYIKNTLIKIQTEEVSKALFDFSTIDYFNERVINYYYNNYISEIDNYKDFLELILKILEQILENNLTIIRKYFNEKSQKYFLDLIDKLEKDIDKLKLKKSLHSKLLNNIRRSRTEIQNSIDLITSWFELNKQKDVNFALEDVIDTSREIITNLFSSVALKISYESKNYDTFEGKHFTSFVDCFKIFFENIINYVRSCNDISTDVQIFVEDYPEYFTCKITNVLLKTEEADLKTFDEIIKQKEIEIDEASVNSAANRKEGNTGLMKATNIIQRTFANPNNSLLFRREELIIIIEMKIYKKGLVYETLDS